MTGISIASGKLVTIVAKITITMEISPIQFCLYGATTSCLSLSFEIDPSIAFFRKCRVTRVNNNIT